MSMALCFLFDCLKCVLNYIRALASTIPERRREKVDLAIDGAIMLAIWYLSFWNLPQAHPSYFTNDRILLYLTAAAITVALKPVVDCVVWNAGWHVYPPGPKMLPVVGSLLQLNLEEPHETLLKWKKEFGPVFTIGMPKPVVVFANADMIQYCIKKYSFGSSGRPNTYLYRMFLGSHPDGAGIILASKEVWKKARAYSQRFLNQYNVNNEGVVPEIEHHAQKVLKIIADSMQGKDEAVLDLQKCLSFGIASIIYKMLLGVTYNFEEEEIWRLKEMIDSILLLVQSPFMKLIDCFPWIAPFMKTDRVYRSKGEYLSKYFEHHLQHRKDIYDGKISDAKICPRNIFSMYLEQKRDPIFDDKNICILAGDLWTGGMETALTAIRWGIIHLMQNPEIQDRLYQEISEFYPPGAAIQYKDLDELPFTHATIDEILRTANVLPWNIPHRALEDMVIGDYFIPKDTEIMFSFSAIMMDEKIFPEPKKFRPERFMSDDGEYKPNPNSMPFGTGPRRCVGQSLAIKEIFTFLVLLVQRYHFAEAEEAPSMERSRAITSAPKPYDTLVRKRELFDEYERKEKQKKLMFY